MLRAMYDDSNCSGGSSLEFEEEEKSTSRFYSRKGILISLLQALKLQVTLIKSLLLVPFLK